MPQNADTGGHYETVHLFSQGLLSKWGFSDGDVLDDPLWDEADRRGDDPRGHDEHAVLIRAVREYLLPRLDQSVEVETTSTIHNPIRATKVDGVEVEVDGNSDYDDIHLTPEWVEVPLAVLYEWWVSPNAS
jgi:hypothetical protein